MGTRSRPRRLGLVSLVGLVGLIGATELIATPPAFAEDAASLARQRAFREQYERAGRCYAAKDYAGAIPALQAAFAIQPVPQILFNIAQAYRKLGSFGSARVYFELYRSMSPDLSPEVSQQVDVYLRELAEQEQKARTPQIVEKTKLLYVQQEKPLPRWLRPFGAVSGLLGVGSLAAGVSLLALNGRCTSPPVAPILECEQVYNTQTPGTALTAVGAGLFVLGVVTFGVSFKRPSRPAVQEVAPESELLPSLPMLTPKVDPSVEPRPAGY